MNAAGSVCGVRDRAPAIDFNVYGLLPVPDADSDVNDDPQLPLTHEYGLLRILKELLEENSVKSLKDVGLPSLEDFRATDGDGHCQLCTLFIS